MPQVVAIPFAIPPSLPAWWILQHSTQVLVHHLLYARGLIPMSVLQLQQQHQQQDPPKIKPSLRRKINRICSSLDDFQNDLQSLNRKWLQKCSMVLISIGPSWSRTREYYLLDATGLLSLDDADFNNVSTSPLVLARKLVPRLVENDVELPCRIAPSFQLLVSLFWTQEVYDKLTSQDVNDSSMWNQERKIRRPGFQVLPHFEPSEDTRNSHTMSRNLAKKQRLVRIELSQSFNKKQTAAQSSHVEIDETTGHWFSMGTSIKGFRI